MATLSGLLWGYVAWVSSSHAAGSSSLDWKLYASAGLATFAVVPYTGLVIVPVNTELKRRAKVAKEAEHQTVEFGTESEVLLAKWFDMTYVRAVLPMVGAWVGLYAALK